MQNSLHRRAVLAGIAAGTTGIAGCTGVGAPTNTNPTSRSTTVPPVPEPAADFPVLPDRDVAFSGEVSFPEPGQCGWLLDFSFTGALDLSTTTPDGGGVGVTVTDEHVNDDGSGGGATLAAFESPDEVDTLEITDGVASIVLEAETASTVAVEMSVELS